MMGGLGSGRPGGWGRDKVEAFPSIDVNVLHRAGCLRPGWQGGRQWHQDGEQVAEVAIRTEQGRLHCNYRTRARHGGWEDFVETLEIVRVPCRFGGERPYFICQGGLDGDACGRRVGKLYRVDRRFLCRHCCRLTYASQCEGRLLRLRRKARKAAARVDARASTWFDLQRPKGMWRRTYDRLHRHAFDLEMQAEDAFEARCAQLEEQLNEKERKKAPRR
jgi:hypothetical protein